MDEFSVCDPFDAASKEGMAGMEHPIFSISTKPDVSKRRYENGPNFVEITPSVEGLATVHDRDILIYCISQVVAALNEGHPVSRKLRFRAHDMLTTTNRQTDGDSYRRLRSTLVRLAGTRIETNITTGAVEILDGFGLIERYRIVRETRNGRMQEIEIELSDWVYNAIRSQEVLTLSRDYFRLRKPLERRVYEIARKHCGQQKTWRIGLEKLRLKCGSNSDLRQFRRLIRNIVHEDIEHAHMPDYAIRLSEDGDQVIFTSRGTSPNPVTETISVPPLDPDIYEIARDLAPGWDVRMIEQEWRQWITEKPKQPEAAFLGFVRKWAGRRDRPD